MGYASEFCTTRPPNSFQHDSLKQSLGDSVEHFFHIHYRPSFVSKMAGRYGRMGVEKKNGKFGGGDGNSKKQISSKNENTTFIITYHEGPIHSRPKPSFWIVDKSRI